RCLLLRRRLTAAAATAAATAPLPARSAHRVFDRSAHTDRIQELAWLGRLREAREVFDAMPHRSIFAWNTMISAYCNSGMLEDARSLVDAISGGNVRTSTILLSGYARLGRVLDARRVFDGMLERNTIAWNAMVSCYVRNGDVTMARRLFDAMPSKDVTSWNSMLTGYCHSRQMVDAWHLFEQMPERNLVSWTVVISGYARIEQHGKAWDIFRMMHREGVSPDQSNFASVLLAVTGLRDLGVLEGLRPLALKTGFESDVVIGTSMLNAYTRDASALDTAMKFFEGMPERNEYTWSTMIAALSHGGRIDAATAVYERDPVKSIPCQTALLTGLARCGRITDARILFDQIPDPIVVSWNAMITGYMQNGMVDEAKELFDRMPFRNTISWAGMICGNMEYVRQVFSRMRVKDTVSWNSFISAYAQAERGTEAVEFFKIMLHKHEVPNSPILTILLSMCGSLGAPKLGQQIHTVAIKHGRDSELIVANALMSMYFKCGSADSHKVFDSMEERDIFTWNSFITGCAQHGLGREAIKMYKHMRSAGVLPNEVTFVGLLNACSHAGLVDEGW
uniref:Pentacotripeptide-repeat region of PRORP domain-containing protein n=1 Tax=Aegilops tauschii subsp. strangulata TaxID=200361 RepID=A0A452ZLT8_AEGTS